MNTTRNIAQHPRMLIPTDNPAIVAVSLPPEEDSLGFAWFSSPVVGTVPLPSVVIGDVVLVVLVVVGWVGESGTERYQVKSHEKREILKKKRLTCTTSIFCICCWMKVDTA